MYTGQEATVTTLYGTTDWLKIRKGVQQGYLLSPCLFNLYAEHIMKNAGLDELQAGVKTGGRNLNNLRYVDDTIVMAESEEEVKRLLRVKGESERAGLKLSIKKTKIVVSSHITSWQIEGEKVKVVTDLPGSGSKITVSGDCNHEIRRRLPVGRKAMTNLDNVLKSRDVILLTKDYIV